ncbi:MAG: translocation/assembly module TamB domain-containing protein [Candidatus Omnitrophica bacterium]|nr:translocation/assembly module TamB domain-containing protein [Candidatus Omnitrophota bacterium]
MKRNSLKHLFLSLLVIFCWVAIPVCVAAYTFLTTTWGAKTVVTQLMKFYMPLAQVTIGSYEGTIEKGLLLKEVAIHHIPAMEKEDALYLQQLYVQIPLIDWRQVFVKITNGRLVLGSSDPMVFNGLMIRDQIQGNCYARSVDVRHLIAVLGYHDLARLLYGFISHVDLRVQGAVFSPWFIGHFLVDHITYKGTRLSDGFGRLDLMVKSLGPHPLMTGYVIMDSALVETGRINVDLTTSKADFKGDALNPLLDIHGSSKVEDINIDIAIKGPLQRPQLMFNSDPPLPEDEIKFALATGKSWAGIDDQSRGVGLRKKLTDEFNVGMEVEEIPFRPGQTQNPGYAKTIEGQMHVTDKLSVNIAKKFLPADTATTSGTSQPEKDNEAEFYLKYKQRF